MLARNFRTRRGEIDLIAEKDSTIVFIEVKTWIRTGFEDLEYAMNEQKMKRIIAASKEFIYRNPEYENRQARYDMVFIGNDFSLEHIVDAFTETL